MTIGDIGDAAAYIALGLSAWLTVRTLGLLDRASHSLYSTYLPPRDAIDFPTMPHFVVEYQNTGTVPVTFSDFELMLPRLEDVLDENGKFRVLTTGAELFIDKRPTSRIGAQQQFSKIDYRTNKVRLEPGDSHTDFFDLGALLPELFNPEDAQLGQLIPSDFQPVLTFHDSFGNFFYCDAEGVQDGKYEYPHRQALLEAVEYGALPPELVSSGPPRLRKYGDWQFEYKATDKSNEQAREQARALNAGG